MPRVRGGSFRSVVHPHRTGEYASGALGRETTRPQDPGSSPGQALAPPRYGTVVNKVGERGTAARNWTPMP